MLRRKRWLCSRTFHLFRFLAFESGDSGRESLPARILNQGRVYIEWLPFLKCNEDEGRKGFVGTGTSIRKSLGGGVGHGVETELGVFKEPHPGHCYVCWNQRAGGLKTWASVLRVLGAMEGLGQRRKML